MELWDLRFDAPTELLRGFFKFKLLGRGRREWVMRDMQLNMQRGEGYREGETVGVRLKAEAR
jgi:hypothetical protein